VDKYLRELCKAIPLWLQLDVEFHSTNMKTDWLVIKDSTLTLADILDMLKPLTTDVFANKKDVVQVK
jgi:hypothetical protein